jgi:hypothetical protein
MGSATTGRERFDAMVIFGLVPNTSTVTIIEMAYIISRNNRFYVVAYDGNDPRTGKERRRWHPAGRSRADAEAIAVRLSAERHGARERPTSALTVERFLLEVWLPRRRRELRPSTARRYQWYIAITRELIGRNVACHVRSRRRPPAQAAARSWTAQELHQFLTAASSQPL